MAGCDIFTYSDNEKVIEFLKQYISQYGVPKRIRTDTGTVFVGEEFLRFCKQSGIEQITCPVRDHRGNGKTERLIRTINERLRTNKQIILRKDQPELLEILYALRISKKKDGRSAFEKQMGKEGNAQNPASGSIPIVGLPNGKWRESRSPQQVIERTKAPTKNEEVRN